MLTYILRSASLAWLFVTNPVATSPLLARSSYVVKDSHNVPNGWTNVGPAPSNALLNLHIGLKQGKYEALERNLYEGG